MSSKYADKRARRNLLPGFPVEDRFTTPEGLAEYFGGAKITCLRCGKMYRTLSVHLKTIHEMEPDEYKEIYGIPWTYGLSCAATTQLHSDHAKHMIDSGTWTPSAEQAALARGSLDKQRKRQPVRDVLTKRNLDALNKGKSGEEARRRKAAPKRGTPEYKEAMRQRPQAQGEDKKEFLRTYWKGRKQSPEHVAKRMARHK